MDRDTRGSYCWIQSLLLGQHFIFTSAPEHSKLLQPVVAKSTIFFLNSFFVSQTLSFCITTKPRGGEQHVEKVLPPVLTDRGGSRGRWADSCYFHRILA